jgi:glycosyltransferase involved in cell wall biosynthesis
MKIVCIATSRIPSDTANSIQVMKTSQALHQLGHEVVLIVPGHQTRPWNELAAHYGLSSTPFQVQWLPARNSLRRYDFCLGAVRLARQHEADLLYLWPLQASLIGLIYRLPLILELHGPPEGLLGPQLFRLLLRMQGSKRLCPITEALQRILERDYRTHLSADLCVVAPNAVDLERYSHLPERGDARRQLNFPQALTVGYTGHLYPGRGISLLLELARRHPDIQFAWIGGRPGDVSYWVSRLKREGVRNVLLPGFVDNIRLPLYQAAMDILLMPYEREIEGSGGGNSAEYCSPMKMFEYLASGRAIISSDLPPLREVLDEETAILCPPEDPEAWSEALGALIADPARANQLGASARRRADRYTWTARQERILAGF